MNPLMIYMKRRVATTLQDDTRGANNDADGYLKMKSSGEFVDQAVTEDNVGNTGSFKENTPSTDGYVQAADDKDQLPTSNDDEDKGEGCEKNDGEKNEYLQLKADDEDVDSKKMS